MSQEQSFWSKVEEIPADQGEEVTIETTTESGEFTARRCWRVNRTVRRVCRRPRIIVYYTDTYRCDNGTSYSVSGSYDGGRC